MPAVSRKQFRWLFTGDAKKKLGAAGVEEWKGATGSPDGLPEEAPKKKHLLGGAVKLRKPHG